MVEQAKHKKLWVHACMMLALMVVFHVIPPLGVITEVGMRLIGVFLAMLYGWTTCAPPQTASEKMQPLTQVIKS